MAKRQIRVQFPDGKSEVIGSAQGTHAVIQQESQPSYVTRPARWVIMGVSATEAGAQGIARKWNRYSTSAARPAQVVAAAVV